jgi:Protein of unknown function (DUF1036)
MRGLQGSLFAVPLTAVVLAAKTILIDPAQAQQPPPAQTPLPGHFAFQVCNQSAYKVMMAVVYLQAPDSNNFISSGWWPFEAHSPCVNWPGANLPVFFLPKGMFYHHEEAWGRPDIYWPADDKKLCVRSQSQTWFGPANPNCRTDERSVGFTALNVTDDLYTWTMHDR